MVTKAVDGEQDQARRRRGRDAERQLVAGPHEIGRHKVDLQPAVGPIDRERRHRVAQRTGEDLLGIDVSHQGDVDVRVALQILGDADPGKSRVRFGPEPPEGVEPLPFDRDEPGAGVGCRDLHHDLLAGPVLGAVEFEVELRVALQVAREIGGAGHRELHPAQLDAPAYDFQRVAPGLRRRQHDLGAFLRQRERLAPDLAFLQHRLVGEGAVLLLHEGRHVAPLEQHGFETGDRPGRSVRPDGHEPHRTLGVAGDEGEVAVRPVADQRLGRRQKRPGNGHHTASAADLEPLRLQPEPVDAVLVPPQVERQPGDSVVPGDGLGEFDGDRPRQGVRIPVRIGERELRKRVELRRDRVERQRSSHPPSLRRRAEQVLQRHQSNVIAGSHPAVLGTPNDGRANA